MDHEKIAERIAKDIVGAKGLIRIMHFEQDPGSLYVLLMWHYIFGRDATGVFVKNGITETDKAFNSDKSKLKSWGKFDEASSSGYVLSSGRGMRYNRSVEARLAIPQGESGDLVKDLEKLGFDWSRK